MSRSGSSFTIPGSAECDVGSVGRASPAIIGGIAFLVAVAFWNGMMMASIVPRWCAACLIFGLLFQGSSKFTAAHLAGILWIGWATLSLTWSANPINGVGVLLQIIIMMACFSVGARTQSLRPVYAGMAIGLSLSSVVMLWQFQVDRSVVWPSMTDVSGLFTNANTAGEIAVMVMIGAANERMWWAVPLTLAPVFAYSGRGYMIALASAIVVWLWERSRIATAALLAVGAGYVAWVSMYPGKISSTSERVDLYLDTLGSIKFWGWGLGSFETTYGIGATRIDTLARHPEHAHSDFLELIYELGPGALFAFAFIWYLMRNAPANTERLVMVSFLVMALFGFPIHMPATAFLAALVAGRLSQSGDAVLCLHGHGRSVFERG